MRAALQSFADASYPIGLCTNKPAGPARDFLAAFDLLPFFAVILGGDGLPEKKPHPEPLRAPLRALGSIRALYVGDSEVDAETAAAAGIPLLLFTEGYRKTPTADLPDRATFGTFAELPDLVRQYAG